MRLPNFLHWKRWKTKKEVPAPGKQPNDIYIEYSEASLPVRINIRKITKRYFTLLTKSQHNDPRLHLHWFDAPGERDNDPLIHIIAIIYDEELTDERKNQIARIVWAKAIEAGGISE